MGQYSFHPGDPVIYVRTKHSPHPGPRAKKITPAAQGDDYTYLVSKFWIVEEVLDDGNLLLRTRRGKKHLVSKEDPNLRPAALWERWLFQSRFPRLDEEVSTSPEQSRATTKTH